MSEVIDITKRRFVGTRETLIYGIANSGQVMTASLITGYLTYFYVMNCQVKCATSCRNT